MEVECPRGTAVRRANYPCIRPGLTLGRNAYLKMYGSREQLCSPLDTPLAVICKCVCVYICKY